jgi:hypothetical protein
MLYDETDPFGPDSLQDITSQGTIVTHGWVPLNLLDQRKNAAANKRPEEKVIAEHSINGTTLTVRPREIAVADKKNQFLGEAKTAHQVSVFTSFAGIKVPARMTQKKFERRYAILGFVMKFADATGVSPATSGISIRKGGSGTTINSSGGVLMPGDVFGARLPSLNDEARSLQYASESVRRAPYSMPSGKVTATIKKITYKDIIGEFHSVAEHLILNNARINLPDQRRYGAAPQREYSELDHEASCLKKYNCAAFLSGVQAVLETGLVVPTMPNTLAGDILIKWEENRSMITSDGNNAAILAHRWLPGPSNDVEMDAAVNKILADIIAVPAGVNNAATANAQKAAIRVAIEELSRGWSGRFEPISPNDPATKIARENSYKQVISALAVKFGIAMDTSASLTTGIQNDENFDMTLAANVRLLIGSVGEALYDSRQSLVDYVKKDLDNIQSTKRDSFGTPVTSDMSVAEQIFKTYNEAGSEWVKLCGRSLDNAMRPAMGTVLNHSRPNNALHYSLT